MSEQGREYWHPKLLKLMDETKKELGIFIQYRSKGDLLKIETDKATYEIKVTNPKEREVIFLNNNTGSILKNITGVIIGSSLTGRGTMVKLGWMAENYLLCFWIEGGVGELREIVKRVWINNQLIIPLGTSEASSDEKDKFGFYK